MSSRSGEIARHFCMSDVPAAIVPGTRLGDILDKMYSGRPLSALALNYLQQQSFGLLYQLAVAEISYDSFVAMAGAAQESRDAAAALKQQAIAEERLAQEARRRAMEDEWIARRKSELAAAEAARIARMSDPSYLAEMKARALRAKYGVSGVDKILLTRLMFILEQVDAEHRLTEEDIVWLSTVARDCFSRELRDAHHLREATFLAGEFHRTRDPWKAAGASSHFRQCRRPHEALELLDCLPLSELGNPKIKSVLCTTRGGVMRDLGQRDEALRLGAQAHLLQPRNFHPCTLLGAVHMESGNFAEGHAWYTKAQERGASERVIDSELRSIFQRADPTRRAAMKAYLLTNDPDRFQWVNERSQRNA